MSVITSFFPGHIRLRCPILKDKDITDAVISAVKELGVNADFTHNPKTGSLLVEYDPKEITIERVSVLKPMLSGVMKLKPKVLLYCPKDKPFLLSEIERLKEEAKRLL